MSVQRCVDADSPQSVAVSRSVARWAEHLLRAEVAPLWGVVDELVSAAWDISRGTTAHCHWGLFLGRAPVCVRQPASPSGPLPSAGTNDAEGEETISESSNFLSKLKS